MEREVDEIINYQPGWVIRNGNLLFLFFFILLLSVSFLINSPEVIKIPANLVQVNTVRGDSAGQMMLMIHNDWIGQINPGDKAVIHFEFAALNSAGFTAVVLGISKSLSQNDSALLAISIPPELLMSDTKKIRLVGNEKATATIFNKQKLSGYLWKRIKGVFKIKD